MNGWNGDTLRVGDFSARVLKGNEPVAKGPWLVYFSYWPEEPFPVQTEELAREYAEAGLEIYLEITIAGFTTKMKEARERLETLAAEAATGE